MFNMNISTR